MIRVGGLAPLSSTDWPGMLAAVVFCQGCPWKCSYCQNPNLIPAQGEHAIPWGDVMAFLRNRQGLLDGVVFSGGEPTLQKDLVKAMQAVRALGFKVGLHTAGMYPSRLASLLPFVDWVGLDVKAPFDAYEQLTGAVGSGGRVAASLDVVLQSGVDYEIRTTVHSALLSDPKVEALGRELAAQGVRHYALQAFRSQGCADAQLAQGAGRQRPLQALADGLSASFDTVTVRG